MEKEQHSNVYEFTGDNGSLSSEDGGTVIDHKDMLAMGKTPVLRRNFRFISMLGFASAVMVSWEVLLPFFVFSLMDGGTPVLFWGFIVIAIIMTLVYASLAEMASMCPTAGGQYHIVSELAPPNAQKVLSYIVGWLTATGWQAYLGGGCFIAASAIQGLISLNNETYLAQRWHTTLLSIAAIFVGISFNSLAAKQLPLLGKVSGFLHLIGPFAIGITLLATAPLGSPREVLLNFTNNGGWPTTGLSAMIGLSGPLSTLIGYDCSLHMSEEIRDASLALPRTIMASVGVNSLLLIFLITALVFTVGDVDSVLQSTTGQPFIQVFYNATQSYVATNILTAMLIVLLVAGCVGEVATASRQIWSFARDGGLPFSEWLANVSSGKRVPLRAITVSVVISSLLACINLGSTTALNAINALGLCSLLSSYFITISCMIWRRLKGAPLPPRRWSLGRYGLAINILALILVTPLWFFAFWPLATPVTAETINWAPTMFGGIIILAMAFYFVRARHVYKGPVVLVKRDI